MKTLSQPQKVQIVYRELRRQFYPGIPAGRLLALSARLVEQVGQVLSIETDSQWSTQQRAGVSVDEAIKDGGWLLYYRETDWRDLEYEDRLVRIPKCIAVRMYPEMEKSLFPGDQLKIGVGMFWHRKYQNEE